MGKFLLNPVWLKKNILIQYLKERWEHPTWGGNILAQGKDKSMAVSQY